MSHLWDKGDVMKKRILIGAESFEDIIAGDYFYVDKTPFINELLDNRGKTTLITRPRRFGKTLNMSMLEYFFDINMDSASLFDGLKIMEKSDIINRYMNKYPVVSLTLKNVELDSYKNSITRLKSIVSLIYRQNRYLCESGALDKIQRKKFKRYWLEKAKAEELQYSLYFLTECLYAHHNKRTIVLVDEYDTPIDTSAREGYYEDMIKFMRVFLGDVFKSNKFLEFGVLTGIQRISKESLLSSFNNPKISGIMDKDFPTSFGFTEDEVRSACETYGLGKKFVEVEEWYNGYRFGGCDIYNPWSITGFLDNSQFKNYWVNTGGITILQDIFAKGTQGLRDDMAGLMTGTPVKMKYVEKIKYPIPYKNDDIFWSMLLNTGYIKPCAGSEGDDFYAELVNKEVKNIFTDCIEGWLSDGEYETPKIIKKFVDCLLNGDAGGVSEILNKDLLNNPSCHDFKEENSYHMFIYGILLAVSGDYTVYSNPETGKGRSDCLIKPMDKRKPAIAIEFKHKTKNNKNLKKEAQIGLSQIEDKAYIHNLKSEGYSNIYKYGIAFHKKNCEVVMQGINSHGINGF